jgi:outer membrane protein
MQYAVLKQASSIVMITLAVALANLPVTASAADDPWQIRFAVVSMDPSGTSVIVPETGESFSYDSSSGTGLGIDLEYRASRRLGIDFGVLSASPGIDVDVGAQPLTISGSGDINITPIYAGLNIHLTPDSRFDLYIGPLLAYVRYSEFKLAAGPGLVEAFTTENGFGIGGVVGLDIGLGDGRWSLNAAVRYIDTTLEATSSDGGLGKTDIDPMICSVGFGFKF